MTFRTRIPAALATVALLATAACESATYSDRAADGTLSFSYAGSASGAFSANGGYDRLRPDRAGWAVGNRAALQSGEQALAVYARTDRGDENLVNEFILYVENPQVGTFTCAMEQETCPIGGIFILGTEPGGEEAQAIYTSVSGTVNIASMSDTAARGSFTLSLQALDFSETPATVQVTSGTFNVPLVAAADL